MRTRRLDRIVTRLYDDALRPLGLKSTQLALLVGISEGATSPLLLGQAFEAEKSTVSRNVGRLVERGWVEVSEAAEGRGQQLALTSEGQALLVAARKPWVEAQRRVRALLGDETADALAGSW